MNYKRAFIDQRGKAIIRGIDWNLTYEQWLTIWRNKIHKRGKGIGKYNMCRKNDTGAYEIDNVFIALHEDNANHGNHKNKFKPVIVENKKYNSIVEATAYTGIEGYTIQYRIKTNKIGYEYA